MALFLRKSRAHLALGQSEAFCSELTPLVEAALQREEAIAELAASGAATAAGGAAGEDGPEGSGGALPQKLRRALVRLGKDGARREGAEEESVFKGYKSRNRRKHDVIAADQAAAALVTTLQRRAAAAAGGGGGEGDGGGGAEGEGVLPGGADLFEDDQFFDSFVQLCRALASSGRGQAAAALVARAAAMAKAAAGSAAKVEFRDRAAVMRALGSSGAARRRRAQLRQLAAEVECATGDTRSSAHHVRSLCSSWAYSWAAWGLYCRVLSRLGGLRRWGRFVRVMRAKHPDSLALAVLQAHALEQSGDHSEASGEYAVALRSLPNEPLLLLCLGVSQLALATADRRGGRARKRNTAALRGLAALHSYARARGITSESEYNLGRAAHGLGLLHVAVAHYERALQAADGAAEAAAAAGGGGAAAAQGGGDTEMGEASEEQEQEEEEQDNGGAGPGAGRVAEDKGPGTREGRAPPRTLEARALEEGLSREAAHNLVHIYRRTGAGELARQVMRRYLVF